MSPYRRVAIRPRVKNPLRKKDRKERFSIPLLLSLLIHALLIALIAIIFARRAAEKPVPPPEPPMPEVTLEIPPPEKERPFMEAKEIADKAPEKAPFESDENTKAASELPPTGSAPLPSQQGLVQKNLELQTQHYTPGEQPAIPSPTATPQDSATPQPTPPTPPPPNSVKLLDLPGEESIPRPTPNPNNAPNEQTDAQSARKGYQPETKQTVIYGSISNRGRSSVAAEATPLGRYKKKIFTAIGSRWSYYTNEATPNIGTVIISFKITASGKTTDIHVLSGTSNSVLTDCSLRSIMDATIPPIPPEVAATLQDGCIVIPSMIFTIY